MATLPASITTRLLQVPVAGDREERVASPVRPERDCVGVERRLDHLHASVLVDKGQANLNATVAPVVSSCCQSLLRIFSRVMSTLVEGQRSQMCSGRILNFVEASIR